MKFNIFVAAFLVLSAEAIKVEKDKSDEQLMDEILKDTPFSGNHNHKKDNAFLTEVFRKYSELAKDEKDEVNGKRVLTPWTAKYAAKDILREWKGLKGDELDNYVESE